MKSLLRLLGLAVFLPAVVASANAEDPLIPVPAYASIQEAIDRNPGKPVFVPAGDHPITEAIRITTPDSGLWGPGASCSRIPTRASSN